MDLAGSFIFAGAGILLVLLAALDLLWTTIAVAGGGGPLTSRLGRSLWKVVRVLHRRGYHGVLHAAGVCIAALTVLIWALLLWAGWSLIFMSDPGAVVASITGERADYISRIYFAGFNVFSLGVGDYVPKGALWQLLTPLATLSGVGLLTLAVTYLVPVVQAVTQKQVLARQIRLLGANPWEMATQILQKGHDQALQRQLQQLSEPILTLSERHHAYPILHYFHAPNLSQAVGAAIVSLDEAITLVEHGVEQRDHPAATVLSSLRTAIDVYMETLSSNYVLPSPESPPAPSLMPLRQAGFQVNDQRAFEQAMLGLDQRRRLLLALIHHEARDWDAVYQA